MNSEIVEFKPEYAGQVKQVIHVTLNDVGLTFGEIGIQDDSDLDHISDKFRGRARFWVMMRGEKVIGTVGVAEIDQNEARLKRMFVLPEYHGKNIGQRLLNHAMRFAKEQGYRKVTLNTDPKMKRAHGFYEKNGFRIFNKSKERYSYEKYL